MKQTFVKNALTATLLMVALLALEHWSPVFPDRGVPGLLRLGVAQARGRNPLIWEGLWKAGNGYYENLLGNGDEPAASQTMITRLLHGKLPWGMTPVQHQIYEERPFLLWSPKANLNFDDAREGPTFTNSYGYFDIEHSLAKPEGVRRIAILGDSISRGWGVTLDQRFDTLLQSRLNAESRETFELLNFSVPGYRLPAIYDVAMEDVPKFHPDVYVVSMSDLCVTPRWGSELVSLVNKGEDLKFDFLRDLARKADLKKGDSDVLGDWKLAPYRLAATRDMLSRLKAHADQEGAQMIVVFVPAAEDPYVLKGRFRDLRETLEGTGIQIVDLLDAFDGVDVENARTEWYDPHPNALGHRLLADDFIRKLHQDPAIWASFSAQSPIQLAGSVTTTPRKAVPSLQ